MEFNRVHLSEEVEVPSPAQKVLSFLWNIENMAHYEPSITSLQVFPRSTKAGIYSARGSFAHLPWEARFSYNLTRNGYVDRLLAGSYGIWMGSGFKVKEGSEKDCRLLHFKNYVFPAWMKPLQPALKLYLRWSLQKELWNIRKRLGDWKVA